MRLDASSGALFFDKGAVEKGMTRARFLASALAGGATIVVENEGHRTYRLAPPLHLDRRPVVAQLRFADEALRAVSVRFADPGAGSSWGKWSAVKERVLQKAHTKWLRTFLDGAGPRWAFDWGVVESVFDAKSGDSAILILFVGD